MSTSNQPSEAELRAAYEAEIKQLRVEHVLLEEIVSLVNLGMRRTGLAPGTEDERDIEQVRLAIEAVRALLPLIEPAGAPQVAQIRQALAQLQLAFVKLGGTPGPDTAGQPADPGQPAGAGPATGAGQGAGEGQGSAGAGAAAPPAGASPDPGSAGDAGPAQRSGRLWIPGQ
jgi:hypothetical protein